MSERPANSNESRVQAGAFPYVIDNQTHRLVDVLNSILESHEGRSLDIASAYFTAGGFGLLRQGLLALGNFRFILGAEPTSGEQIGLRPNPGLIPGLLKGDLETLAFDERTLRLVEDLIAYLQRDSVQVRLYDARFSPCEVLALLFRPSRAADAVRPVPPDSWRL